MTHSTGPAKLYSVEQHTIHGNAAANMRQRRSLTSSFILSMSRHMSCDWPSGRSLIGTLILQPMQGRSMCLCCKSVAQQSKMLLPLALRGVLKTFHEISWGQQVLRSTAVFNGNCVHCNTCKHVLLHTSPCQQGDPTAAKAALGLNINYWIIA